MSSVLKTMGTQLDQLITSTPVAGEFYKWFNLNVGAHLWTGIGKISAVAAPHFNTHVAPQWNNHSFAINCVGVVLVLLFFRALLNH